MWSMSSLFKHIPKFQDKKFFIMMMIIVATPLWAKWEDETPTPKVEDLESSGIPECLEFDSKAQNTSH
jgi:hypothetical protein